MLHIQLKAEEYYDILSAHEELLEETHRARRRSAESPRHIQLQQQYLQQAVNLGLIPIKYSKSPVRQRRVASPSPSPRSPTPAKPKSRLAVPNAQRPVPPPGFGDGRLSRNRIAQELALADGAHANNTAVAALAATRALYRSPDSPTSTTSSQSSKSLGTGSASASSSDTEQSQDSLASTASDLALPPGGGRDADSSCGGSNAAGSPQQRLNRDVLRVAEELLKLAKFRGKELHSGGQHNQVGDGRHRGVETGGGGAGNDNANKAPPRRLGGSSGGGSRAAGLLLEPTQSFLRRWRAARKRRTAKKQAVRFLLRCPGDDERGSDGDTPRAKQTGNMAARTGQLTPARRSASSSAGEGPSTSAFPGSGGGAVPVAPGGVYIVYPGSSLIFPAQPLPYSFEEALEAVRRQQQQQQQGPHGMLSPQGPQRQQEQQHLPLWCQQPPPSQPPPPPPQQQQQQQPVALWEGPQLQQPSPGSAPEASQFHPQGMPGYNTRWSVSPEMRPMMSLPPAGPRWEPARQSAPQGHQSLAGLKLDGPYADAAALQSRQLAQSPPGWQAQQVGPLSRAAIHFAGGGPRTNAEPGVGGQWGRTAGPPGAAAAAPSSVATDSATSRAGAAAGTHPGVRTWDLGPGGAPAHAAAAATWSVASSEQHLTYRRPYSESGLGYPGTPASSALSYSESQPLPPQARYAEAAQGALDRGGALKDGGGGGAAHAGMRHSYGAFGSDDGLSRAAGVGPRSFGPDGSPPPPPPYTPRPLRPPPSPSSVSSSSTRGAEASPSTFRVGAAAVSLPPGLHAKLQAQSTLQSPSATRPLKAPPPPPVEVPPSSVTHGSDTPLSSPSTALPPPTEAQLEAAAAFPEDPLASPEDRHSSSLGEMSGGPSFGVWAGGPSAGSQSAGSVAGESAASLRVLRNQQSAISRDVEALMQRLADMRGKLDQ